MDLLDRIYELHKILHAASRAVARATPQERLACSRGTVGRIIPELRDLLGAFTSIEKILETEQLGSGQIARRVRILLG